MPKATKGSQRHMQDAVERRQDELAATIVGARPELAGRAIRWLSPLGSENYVEYRDEAFLRVLGLDRFAPDLATFWPRMGPSWDALALVDGREPLLIEAKAHLRETPAPDTCGAESPSSTQLITNSLGRVRKDLGVDLQAPSWTDHHYQIANRLAHLWWLQVERQAPSWLLFLGFTESPDWPDPLSANSWLSLIEDAWRDLGVPSSHVLSDRIIIATMAA